MSHKRKLDWGEALLKDSQGQASQSNSYKRTGDREILPECEIIDDKDVDSLKKLMSNCGISKCELDAYLKEIETNYTNALVELQTLKEHACAYKTKGDELLDKKNKICEELLDVDDSLFIEKNENTQLLLIGCDDNIKLHKSNENITKLQLRKQHLLKLKRSITKNIISYKSRRAKLFKEFLRLSGNYRDSITMCDEPNLITMFSVNEISLETKDKLVKLMQEVKNMKF